MKKTVTLLAAAILLFVGTLPMRGTALYSVNAFIHQSGKLQYALLGLYLAAVLLLPLGKSDARYSSVGRPLLLCLGLVCVTAAIFKGFAGLAVTEHLLLNPPAELPYRGPSLHTSIAIFREGLNHLLVGIVSATTALGASIRDRTKA